MTSPVLVVLLLAVLVLLPFVLVMMTSFVKIAVVLSILRNALGTPRMPPTIIVTGLALVLSLVVMAPVGSEIHRRAAPALMQLSASSGPAETTDAVLAAVAAGAEPLRNFLERHAHARDRAAFTELAQRARLREGQDASEVTDRDFLVLAPSFVTSELTEAFLIGFLIFVPFLIVDIVIANVLMSLGMHMLSPTTVSLPFKLLLFVLVSGWSLVTRGLVGGYL